MKKIYQNFLWISCILLYIIAFLIVVSIIVGTILLLFTDENLLLKGLMSILSCVMLLTICLQIKEIIPPDWKREFKEEIEIQSNDWMEHTWFPLKENIKRKEFWTLQLWPIGKICRYVARLVFTQSIYSVGILGTAYYLLNDPSRIAASDIFTVLITLIIVNLAFICSQFFIHVIRETLTMTRLFEIVVDVLFMNVILITLTESIEKSGRTVEGLKDFLTTFIQFINEYMYLFVSGCVLALIGYVSTKFIKHSIEKEIDIDLIPTLFGYEYYVDYGKYDGLLHTNTVHTSIQEVTNKEIKDSIQGEQKRKFIDRQKKVYNFYEVEASLRYGIGNVCLGGSNIQQNTSYFNWKSEVLEMPKKLPMEEDEIQ